MDICKFCQEKLADKKNTHYLTDAIIRTCLNHNGSNTREKGLYFEISSEKQFIELSFQRIDKETIVDHIGREATEEEIENAKKIPFSVDYIFCSECEDKFTKIEVKFIEKILPQFRNNDLTDLEFLTINEIFICRNFFYLQIFRSAICDKNFKLPKNFIEQIREILFNNLKDSSIPLSISYLQTSGDQKEYTSNYIGYINEENPYIIIMNDFIIQCYENKDNIKYLELYGINDKDYMKFINRDEEEEFIFKIFQNHERKKILKNIMHEEKVIPSINFLKNQFNKICVILFNTKPTELQTHEYITYISNKLNNNKRSFSREYIYQLSLYYVVKVLLKR